MRGPALRRTLHAATALVLLAVPLHSWSLLRAVTLAGLGVALALEALRFAAPRVNMRLRAALPVFRPAEANRVSGATWLMVGYALAAWVAPPAPAAGILVTALADPAAAVLGQRFGAVAGRKTWPGTGAALVVAAAALWALGLPWSAVGAGALAAATLERWPLALDDNLVMPPGVALAVLASA